MRPTYPARLCRLSVGQLAPNRVSTGETIPIGIVVPPLLDLGLSGNHEIGVFVAIDAHKHDHAFKHRDLRIAPWLGYLKPRGINTLSGYND